jgi:hypothetical protein
LEADTKYTPLRLAEKEFVPEIQSIDDQLTKWKQKLLHGRHPNVVNSIPMEMTYKWLTLRYLYPETEGFLIAIQDPIITTKTGSM